ncbi:MAG: PASTA domain-containing protein [Oscillospiraceae bacterium]|nr:PASTA domain-containing protein [Oscillospiraceae bacterium]
MNHPEFNASNAKDYEPSVWMKRKAVFVVLGFVLVLAVMTICRLSYLCVSQHDFYTEKANNKHFSKITINANRGAIYDSSGAPLAWSATVYKVIIDPVQFQSDMKAIDEKMQERMEYLAQGKKLDPDTIVAPMEEIRAEIIQTLAEKLNISEEKVQEATEKNIKYYILKTQVEKNVADELMEYVDHYGLTSIKTEEDTKRYYPQNELAAQVIGFTNSDGEGQYGLEYKYNQYLSGTNGRVISATDAKGKEMPYRYSTTYPAEDGSSLYLTLDSTLQYYLEKNLQAMCEKFKVRNRSCGIIMNAKTGAIYAMGTYPSFDLNNPSMIYDQATNDALQSLPQEEYQEAYVSAREQQWKNKAITELYIPGSVFKIFTTAMAVEEKVVNPETDSFFCNGAYPIPGVPKPIHCHKLAGRGAQTFSEALTNSCNPAFIEVGIRVGVHKFSQYFDAFGLTEKTGIDLPGETSSIYREEKDLGIVDLASSAFGQSNKLTPMEMITGIAAAVNGGYLVEPHVVDKIVSSDGNIIKNFNTNVKRQVISEESSATVRELLQAVVDNNGGSNAYIKGYAIGGKSGTSQKLDQYGDDNMQYVASYACFAPADDPEIVMLLLADEPDTGINYYGSVVVAPYARDIMAEALPYLGYYPEYTSEEYAKLDVTVPQLRDADIASAKQTLEEFGLKYEIKGNGATIVSQCPDTGSTVSAGGKIILYTEENYEPDMIQVPNVMKYRADDANELLTEAGLNYVSQGASTDRTDVLVGDQSVEPGTFVEVGTVIRLDYVVNDQSG